MTTRRSKGFSWPYSSLTKQTLGFRFPPERLAIPNNMIIVPANGTYSQSSVYPGNAAADATSMTNGSAGETTKTATNGGAAGTQWISIDYGSPKLMRRVYLAHHTNALTGGWGNLGEFFTGVDVEISTDNTAWEKVFRLSVNGSYPVGYLGYGMTTGTGVFNVAFPAAKVARYIRLLNAATNSGYIACTEFYATSS